MNKTMRKKGFTIIELIVVVAILGILVMLAGPKLLGYVEKAELTRIQHDVKVMEQEMKLAMLEEVEMNKWDNNAKDLGALVLQDKLFGKEGVAERIDASHLLKSGVLNLAQMDIEFNNNQLGMGGDLIPLEEAPTFTSIDETYKIIPDQYKGVIGTRLGGTFYTNNLGKVYYEHDKPLSGAKEDKILDCPVPLPDYDFKIIEGKGTIVKWNGTEQHLVIPYAFLLEVNGEEQCVPVRIIGKAAFMQGAFKSVIIPESVEIIEDDAFINGELTEITIPHSVEYIGRNAFSNNPVTNSGGSGGTGKIIIRNSPGNVVIGENAFGGRTPTYRRPTAKDLGVIFDHGTGTIISGGRDKKVVNIPDIILVDDVEYPVKKIDKGAYQGLGLISVVLPEGLERIEDYAFAGNQLEGITIPDKVNHIGNYAFAFNEVVHSITGHRKATIGFINIKEEEQIEKVNDLGNIVENGAKVNYLKGEVKLLNHIFVTSIGHDVAFEEYKPIEYEDVVFYGYDDSAYDGDPSTGTSKSGQVKWTGDLNNKEISITSTAGYRSGGGIERHKVSFIDEYGNKLKAFSPNVYQEDISVGGLNGSTSTAKIIVPEGAVAMNISIGVYSGKRGMIYEINGPNSLKQPKNVNNVKSISDDNSITLNWINEELYDQILILRDNVLVGLIDGDSTSFTDELLYSDATYKHEIIAIKDGNMSNKVAYVTKTTKPEIIFYGLMPEAIDGNLETYQNIPANTPMEVTWSGNLNNKTITIHAIGDRSSSVSSRRNTLYLSFLDSNDNVITFPEGQTSFTIGPTSGKKITSIIVPNNASKIELLNSGHSYDARLFELIVE